MLARYHEILSLHELGELNGDGRLAPTPKGLEAYRFLSSSLSRIFGAPEMGSPLRSLGRAPDRR